MRIELVTTLKRQATKILAELHDSKEPVLITEHGQPSAYLVDVQDYEMMQNRMCILEGIAKGEAAILDNRVYTQSEAKEKMAQIIWAEPALLDLNEIAEYIALDKSSAASHLVQTVFSKTERLEEFPESGRKPPELKKSRYKEIIVDPCRIFYRIEKDKVYILYVMRSERKLRKYLLRERSK